MYWLPYSSHTSHNLSHTSLNLLCHSKTHARFMQDASKALWSIPYVSVAFFFQVQNIILLHIVLLKCRHVPIGFLKFTSCDNQTLAGCFPISAVAVNLILIIKIGQSSHKMYSNNILNFGVTKTILNAGTKNVWNKFNAPRNPYVVIKSFHSYW